MKITINKSEYGEFAYRYAKPSEDDDGIAYADDLQDAIGSIKHDFRKEKDLTVTYRGKVVFQKEDGKVVKESIELEEGCGKIVGCKECDHTYNKGLYKNGCPKCKSKGIKKESEEFASDEFLAEKRSPAEQAAFDKAEREVAKKLGMKLPLGKDTDRKTRDKFYAQVNAKLKKAVVKESNVTKRIAELSEGWGAETLNAAVKKGREEIAALKEKYPDKADAIDDLQKKNWNAKGIKDKLGLN